MLQLYLTLCNLMDCGPPGSHPWDSLGKNNRLGCHALPQRIFPTQGLDLCLFYLLHWQAGSLPLASPGKPRFFNLLVALHSMWDLVPQPVMEFMSPALTVQSLHHWATREVPFQMTLTGKEPTCQCRRHKRHRLDSWEDPVEEGMVTYSSILAWRIPWTEEPGRLWSIAFKKSDMTEAT